MPFDPDHLVDEGDIIAVATDGGEVRVTIGDAKRKLGRYKNVPIYCSGAFVSVPTAAADGEAAQALFLQDGNEVRAIGWRDNRADIVGKVGNLATGDAAIVSASSDARMLLKAALHLIALYTENQETGFSMMCALDGDAGEITLSNGDAFIKLKKDEIFMGVNGGAVFRLSKDAVNLQGNGEWKGNIKLGMNCPPGPITPASGAAYSPAGPVNTISTSVAISP